MTSDDIQWAGDEGSRQLVEMRLQDSKLRNAMSILAYHDKEAAQVDIIFVNARAPVLGSIHLLNPDIDVIHRLWDQIMSMFEIATRSSRSEPLATLYA
jgi:hypothetical protein